MEHLMEIMTTGTETFCIVLLLNTFFERKYTSYRFFFPLSAAFLFYLWLPLNTILATSFVTKLFISSSSGLSFLKYFILEHFLFISFSYVPFLSYFPDLITLRSWGFHISFLSRFPMLFPIPHFTSSVLSSLVLCYFYSPLLSTDFSKLKHL